MVIVENAYEGGEESSASTLPIDMGFLSLFSRNELESEAYHERGLLNI